MTYVTVTIDTEEEWDWSGPFPVEDFSVENIRSLPDFQAVCTNFGIRPTYFVNHAVMSDGPGRDVIGRLAETDGVEIGMHLHPWNTPPIHNQRPTVSETFTANLPPELVEGKLNSTWEQFRAVGLVPRSFRGGRYSSGPDVQAFLTAHDFLVDASICPYTSWEDEGSPDYRDQGQEIQRVSVADGQYLWRVPLSRGFTRQPESAWARRWEYIAGSPLRHARLIGILEKTRLAERVWLNFECEDAGRMLRYVRQAKRRGLEHICFTVHSSSLVPGPGPYCRSDEQRQAIFQGIESIFAVLKRDEHFVPVTMTELAHIKEKQYEGDRNQPVG